MSDEPLRVAAALVLDDDGRVFVQRRSPDRRLFPNCWDVVGGHIEPGESVEDALRREVNEETGWQLSHGEKSRLYIARALLQGADLLLLDESFAALDPHTLEATLTSVLREAPAVLVIAHP